MKTKSVLAILMMLTCCKEPSDKPGKIYTGKTYINLSYDNTWIVADRFSSWNQNPVDTPFTSAFYKVVQTIDGTLFRTRYFISTEMGQQYNFLVPGKLNVWLNTASIFRLSYENGKFGRPQLLSGESCIESLDSLTLELTDSLSVFIQKGSCLNFRTNTDDSTIRISLVRGLARIVGDYGAGSIQTTLEQPGLEVRMMKSDAVGHYASYDTTQQLAWRNAQYLLNNDSSLNEILNKVCSWYNIRFELARNINRSSTTDAPLTISYRSSLEEVLSKIESSFNVLVERNGESIFMYENWLDCCGYMKK